jgi:hypothetical protein
LEVNKKDIYLCNFYIMEKRKNKELTYMDIKDMDMNQYMNEYGLGGWIKDNWANLATTVGGVGLGVAGALTANPMLIAAGASMGAQGVSGFKGTADQNAMEAQQAEQAKMLALQSKLDAANQRVQSNNPIVNSPGVMKCGGRLKKYAQGGTLNYNGQSHDGINGGIPIDPNGNPTGQMNQPTALVEGGETSYTNPTGTYIFSDALGFNDKKSFAKRHKEIQKEYGINSKDRGLIKPNDPILLKGYNNATKKLEEQQEKLKQAIEMKNSSVRNMNRQIVRQPEGYEMGGSLPKYRWGGEEGGDNGLIMIDYSNDRRNLSQWRAEQAAKGAMYDKMQLDSESQVTPYRGMGWGDATLAALPGLAGSLINVVRANRLKSPSKLNLSRVSAENINLQRERDSAIEQANLTRSNVGRELRSNTGSIGQYLSGIGSAQTGIGRGLGKQLGQSYQNEELQNAQFRQQAALANADIANREAIYNQQQQAQYDNAKRGMYGQALSQGLSGVTSALNQKIASNQYYDYMNMMNPNMTMNLPDNANWWQRNFQSFQTPVRVERSSNFDYAKYGQNTER